MANEKKVKLVIDQLLPPQGENVVKVYGWGDGGGEGGTSDYNELENKPTVNGVELSGNLTLTSRELPVGSGPAMIGTVAEKLNTYDTKFDAVETAFQEVADEIEKRTANVSAADAGKVLTVKNDGTGVQWTTPTGSVPAYTTTDADKVLGVKTDASGIEWKTLSGSIPAIGTGDEGKQLTVVNNSGTLEAKWDAPMGDVSIKKGTGTRSIIEGDVIDNEASGTYSHAEGTHTKATANQAHAEGGHTEASGINSHVEGTGTIAAGAYQHVQGQYNVKDTANKYADIIGGSSNASARKNIEATDWQGNKYLAGDVYVKCNDDSTGGKKLEPLPEYTVAEDGKTLKVVKQADNTVKLEWGAGGGGEPDEYLKKFEHDLDTKGILSKHKLYDQDNVATDFWTITETGTEGQILVANEDGIPDWQDNIPVPEYATTDKKKVLAVNNSGDNIEWKGYAVPEYSATDDKEKVLAVKEDGTDIEWKKINETPYITLNMGDIYQEETGKEPQEDVGEFTEYVMKYISTHFESGKFYHFINTPFVRSDDGYSVLMENTFWEVLKAEDPDNNVIMYALMNTNSTTIIAETNMDTGDIQAIFVEQGMIPIVSNPFSDGYSLDNIVQYTADGDIESHFADWRPKLGGFDGIPNASSQCLNISQTNIKQVLQHIKNILHDDTIYYFGEIIPITAGEYGNVVVSGEINLKNGMYLYKLDDPASRDSGALFSFNNPKRYLRWTTEADGTIKWEASEGASEGGGLPDFDPADALKILSLRAPVDIGPSEPVWDNNLWIDGNIEDRWANESSYNHVIIGQDSSSANKKNAIVIGDHLQAHRDKEIVLGKYNSDQDAANDGMGIDYSTLSVGVGQNDTNRATGLKLDDVGNLIVSGEMYAYWGDASAYQPTAGHKVGDPGNFNKVYHEGTSVQLHNSTTYEPLKTILEQRLEALPAHTTTDAGKILSVGADGKLTWVSFDTWNGGNF